MNFFKFSILNLFVVMVASNPLDQQIIDMLKPNITYQSNATTYLSSIQVNDFSAVRLQNVEINDIMDYCVDTLCNDENITECKRQIEMIYYTSNATWSINRIEIDPSTQSETTAFIARIFKYTNPETNISYIYIGSGNVVGEIVMPKTTTEDIIQIKNIMFVAFAREIVGSINGTLLPDSPFDVLNANRNGKFLDDDDLNGMIIEKVQSAFPTSYPSGYQNLISSIDTEQLNFNVQFGLSPKDFDDYWNLMRVDPKMKSAGYAQMEALKYSESEIVFLQNVSLSLTSLNYQAKYFLIAGKNVNSSISFAYWYGTVTSTGRQQCQCNMPIISGTSYRGPCDAGSHGGGIFGECNTVSFNTTEVMNIITSLDVASASKIINPS